MEFYFTCIQIFFALLGTSFVLLAIFVTMKTRSFHIYFRSLLICILLITAIHESIDLLTIPLSISGQFSTVHHFLVSTRRFIQEICLESLSISFILLCFERIISQLFPKQYERLKSPIPIVIIIGILIVADITYKTLLFIWNISFMTVAILSIVDAIVLIVILIMWKLNLKNLEACDASELTKKYHLTENIRTNRISVAVVGCGVLFKTITSITISLFLNHIFPSLDNTLLIVYRTSMNVNAVLSSVLVISLHPPYTLCLRRVIGWRDIHCGISTNTHGEALLTPQEMEGHFEQLDTVWMVSQTERSGDTVVDRPMNIPEIRVTSDIHHAQHSLTPALQRKKGFMNIIGNPDLQTITELI